MDKDKESWAETILKLFGKKEDKPETSGEKGADSPGRKGPDKPDSPDKPKTPEKRKPDSPGRKGPDKPDSPDKPNSPDKPKTPEKRKPDGPIRKDFDERIKADPATMKRLDALHKRYRAEGSGSGSPPDTAPDKGHRERDQAAEIKYKGRF